MPSKDIYLFDSANNPLTVAGIRLELFDASTCTLLDAQLSANLNPALGIHSPEWGAKLTFTPCGDPLDVYVTDPKYRYPGNTLRYLNGKTGDRIDIDLLALPAGSGGQAWLPQVATVNELSSWVEDAGKWSGMEKEAVRNLIFNYLDVIVRRLVEYKHQLPHDLHDLAKNWEEALRRVGMPADVLRK